MSLKSPTDMNQSYSRVGSNDATESKPIYLPNGMPSLGIDLRQHKKPIAINWGIVLLSTGFLPIIGYFALEYGTDEELNIVLSPWLAVMGVMSLYTLSLRTWRLCKKTSTCRPLGQTNVWGLDFFDWNFVVGFVGLTILISIGISIEILRVVAIAHSVLLIQVCLQLVFFGIATVMGMNAPFRTSSVDKGQKLRGACYVIIEDIVAVDGGQGQSFRQAWNDRYEASPALRSHLIQMDFIWGVTGLMVAAICFAITFGVDNAEVGYTVGFALPWIWAALMTFLTIKLTQRMLAGENGGAAAHTRV